MEDWLRLVSFEIAKNSPSLFTKETQITRISIVVCIQLASQPRKKIHRLKGKWYNIAKNASFLAAANVFPSTSSFIPDL